MIVPLRLQDLLDYEVDSDDEWEEEEPGESLSNSEVSRITRNFGKVSNLANLIRITNID